MTLAEANALVKAVFALLGQPDAQGLNAAGHGGLKLGTEVVTFQFVQARGALITRAHLYEFRGPPAPGAIERAQAAHAKSANAALGAVTYEADAKLLALTHEDSIVPPPDALLQRVKAMAVAALTFSDLL